MKKLTIILLALAMAAFAVPAFAGDISVSGKYTLDGEDYSGQNDMKRQWFDDEMKVNLGISKGDVKAVINLEVVDNESFDGNSSGTYERSTSPGGNNDFGSDLVESFWVEWTAMDSLKVKIGEYQLNFGRKVVIFEDPIAKHIGLTYSGFEFADVGLYIGKVYEIANDTGEAAADRDDDKDIDAMGLLVNVKGVEFFKKFDFLYVDVNNQYDEVSAGYMGFDTAFMAGPVAVALEYGSVTNDDADQEGNFIYTELGFDELAGFDINLEVFQSSFEDGSLEGTFGGNDFYPYMIYGYRSTSNRTLTDVQLIGISGSYKINDKMTAIGKILASGTAGPDDEAVGMEIDAHLAYKFSDNVSGTFTYATWAPGKAYEAGYGDDSETDMRARLAFSF